MQNIFLLLKNWKRKNNSMALDVIKNMLYLNNTQLPFVKTPQKKYSEGKNSHEFLIFHYTASTTEKSATNTYLDPKTQVSWHLLINKDGQVKQFLPLDKIAWHAGRSYWKHGDDEYVGLNPYSIGIEMVNCGPLTMGKGQLLTSWSGQVIHPNDVFYDKNGNPWQSYSPAQIQTAKVLGVELAKLLGVKDILGHNEISPGRKNDPGPAFKETLDYIRKTYHNRKK